MFRRSLVVLSKRKPRTIVRDPRKKKKKRLPVASPQNNNHALAAQQEPHPEETQMQQQQQRPQMAFAPSRENQQSIGSTMGSYALAGFGMTIGFTFVGALFGGF